MLQLSLHDPEQLLAQVPDAHPVPQSLLHPVPQLPVQVVLQVAEEQPVPHPVLHPVPQLVSQVALHTAVEHPVPQEAVEHVFLQLVLQPCLQLDEHIIQPALLFISTTTCLTSL